MKQATHSPLFVTKELFENRYKGAQAIFVAGSVVRGEATAYSDLDLVVVYPEVKTAYRESFYHMGWPVEAFIHDPETIAYFLTEIDRKAGRASLAEMISEGYEYPVAGPITVELKDLAGQVLQAGPPALTSGETQDRRYRLSGLVDDLREPRSRAELVAAATHVYRELGDYYLRSRKLWTASGKTILKRMKKADPAFTRRFDDAFEMLFANNQPAQVIALVEEVVAPEGGLLFEGYRREVDLTF